MTKRSRNFILLAIMYLTSFVAISSQYELINQNDILKREKIYQIDISIIKLDSLGNHMPTYKKTMLVNS